jgi:DNA polymerase III subunit epsilon
MRQIFLDTETTGLEPKLGHKIIEIGAIEVINRQHTRKSFHRYINPKREIDAGALAVHGISLESLQDKPVFADIADEFLGFVDGADILIHNAAFDVGFLDAELAAIGYPSFGKHVGSITDTLKLARERFPGKRNSLDHLCERLEVDNAHRTLHGALMDASLLADVYLMMTRGQSSLSISLAPTEKVQQAVPDVPLSLKVLTASAAELSAHDAYMAKL